MQEDINFYFNQITSFIEVKNEYLLKINQTIQNFIRTSRYQSDLSAMDLVSSMHLLLKHIFR